MDVLGLMVASALDAGDVLVEHCYDDRGHDCEGWHENFVIDVQHNELTVVTATVDEWGCYDTRTWPADDQVRVLLPRVRKLQRGKRGRILPASRVAVS